MKTQAAFVWPNSAVELNAEATVNLYFTCVVNPGYSEDDLSFGLNDSFHNAELDIFGMFVKNGNEGLKNFFNCLMEFGFASVSFYYSSIEIFGVLFSITQFENPPLILVYFFVT